jgi:hypothetical protein
MVPVLFKKKKNWNGISRGFCFIETDEILTKRPPTSSCFVIHETDLVTKDGSLPVMHIKIYADLGAERRST